MKNVSTAEKVRKYMRKNPTHTVAQVMEATGANKQMVYNLRWAEKKKKIVLTSAEVAVANKIGISTKDYAEQIAKLRKVKTRRATRAEKISNPGVYEVPEIVETHYGVTPIMVDMTQHADGTITEKVTEMPKEWFQPATDNVNHPAHYKVGGIETIDFIEAKGLGYNLGNVIKYITRAEHKGNMYEDLCKARWYLNREIAKHTGEAK